MIAYIFNPEQRLSILYKNSNVLGDIFATGLILYFCLLNISQKKISLIFKIPILILITSMLLTKSLGAVITLGIGIITYYFLNKKYVKKLKIIDKKTILILIILFCLFTSGFYLRQLRTAKDIYANERINIWQTSFQMIRDNIITGVGPGNFKNSAYKYSFPVVYYAKYAKTPGNAHNSILQKFAEQGIIAVILHIYLIILIIINMLHLLSKCDEKKVKIYILTFFSATAGLFCHSMLSVPFEFSTINYLIVIFLASFLFSSNYTYIKLKISTLTFILILILFIILPAANLTGELFYNSGKSKLSQYQNSNNIKTLLLAKKKLETSTLFVPQKPVTYQEIGGIHRILYYSSSKPELKIYHRKKTIYFHNKALNYGKNNYLFYLNCAKINLEFFKIKKMDVTILKQTKSYINKSINLNPYYPENYLLLGDIAYNTDDFKTAEYYIDKSIHIEPYYIKGLIYKLKILYNLNNSKINHTIKNLAVDIKNKMLFLNKKIINSIPDKKLSKKTLSQTKSNKTIKFHFSMINKKYTNMSIVNYLTFLNNCNRKEYGFLMTILNNINNREQL